MKPTGHFLFRAKLFRLNCGEQSPEVVLRWASEPERPMTAIERWKREMDSAYFDGTEILYEVGVPGKDEEAEPVRVAYVSWERRPNVGWVLTGRSFQTADLEPMLETP